MSALSIRLPESLHKNAKVYAAQEGISVNQLISTALAEKLSALATEDYLEQRAAQGTRAKFEAALALVPDVAPTQTGDLP
jgi:post-segregation antitoxin (ccd killing protein)